MSAPESSPQETALQPLSELEREILKLTPGQMMWLMLYAEEVIELVRLGEQLRKPAEHEEIGSKLPGITTKIASAIAKSTANVIERTKESKS